ncbi:MAG: SusC/RagA family TonB-linked outer membrane protein [Bacteroidota bacterium]
MQSDNANMILLALPRKQYRVLPARWVIITLTMLLVSMSSNEANATPASAYFKPFFTVVEVQGKVTNDKNEPMADVSVAIQGKTRGVVTNTLGVFKIQADENDVLVFSYVGYTAQRISLKNNASRKDLHVSLVQSFESNEVVVIGMQTQSKRTTTSAVSTVLGKDIENIPSPSVDALLQGRVAGLNVQVGSGEPGVSPTVVVRGNTKVNTNIGDPNVAQAQALSSPLYVIDGVPVNPTDIANNIDATGTNFLAGINVNDIESIVVQKDAAAAAAWGSQGANGVIYITTKKGRSKIPEFRVNVYNGVSLVPQLLPTLVGSQERRQKLSLINQYAVTPAQQALIPQMLSDSLNPYYNNATDWQGLFYRTGNVRNVDATVSAAAENFNYRVSMNYYDEKGIINAFGFSRYSLRGSFNFKLSSKLNSQFIVSLSKSDRQRGMKYNDNSDDNTPVSGSNQPSSFYRLTAFDSANFTGLYSKIRNKNVNDLYSASFTLNYTIKPWLKYTFQGSANISTSNRDYFKPSNIDQVAALGGIAQPSSVRSDKGSYSTYFMSNTLNFNKHLQGKSGHVHTIVLTATQQYTADVSNTNYVGGTNGPSNDIQVVSGIPQSNLYGGSGYAADGLLSFAAQAQYDFDSKYLLYASYRGDASSRFGNDSKWGYFPAVGTGWVLSDERFMSPLKKYISFFKVRASFGISGNRSSDFYAPYNNYTLPGTYGGAAAIQPSYTNGLTKDNLTWAKTEQKNIGADIQLFNNKVNLAVDVYDKISKDDYYDFQLPFYTGFSGINFNAHDLWVSNRGVDITISANLLPSKSKLHWNTQLTISHNKNAFAKLPNQNRSFVISDAYGVGRIFAVGQPVYEMFQMIYAGVYNNASQIPFNRITGAPLTYFKGNHTVVPGDPIWLDINHIGDVWSGEDNGNQYGDRTPSGDPNPKFTGGWVNDFTYKNFSLTIVSVFTWKRDIINTYRQQQFNNFGGNITNFANNRLPSLDGLNYWTPQAAAKDPNYQANFPSLTPFGGYFYQYFPFSTMFNEDGSYFKIKNIIAGYQLPQNFLKKIGLSSARVYGIVDNVLTLKHSTMANPELVDQLGNYYGGAYPVPTKITLGIDIQF